jgi:hypothetical protein
MTLLLAILTNASAGRIEWLDFILSGSGIAATAAVAFTGLDRSLARLTAHGGVKIALTLSLGPITANGVTYTNAPTHHGGKLATATPADYGATNPVANFADELFRSSSDDHWATSIRDITGTQGIASSGIGLSDFNVPLGSLIHAYSLFSNDVTGIGSAANLAHWSNAAYHPTINRLGGCVGCSDRRSVPQPPPCTRNLRPDFHRSDHQLGRLRASARSARTQNMTGPSAPHATSRAV